MRDRRRQERRPLIHHLSVFRKESDKVFGFLGNVTSRGMLLFSQEPVEADAGAFFPLEMALPDPVLGTKAIAFQASSRWCKQDERTGLYATGFQITDIDPQNASVLSAAMEQYRCHA